MKNNNLKLDLLSAINPEILDRVDAMRERYMFGGKKKRNNAWIPWVAMAACLCIVVGALFAFLPSLLSTGKQVPIYQGMTASGTNPMADNTAMAMTPSTTPLSTWSTPRMDLLTDTKPTPPKPTPPHEKHTEALTDSITDGITGGVTEAITETPTPDFNATSGVYYTKGNQDFYITVHISNPDNFEILSFTLNGVKYSSYMFEQGSNMENLVLKCNVGDAEGIVEYTIDAIKYVDGEQIKDVRMEGDRTIEIRVYPENQPTVAVSDITVDPTTIALTPTITDELGLIADSEGELLVKIYQADTLVTEVAFSSGEAVTITGLAPDTTYQYAIVAIYDAIDGQGKVAHTLKTEAFTTSPVVSFENVAIDGLTATFTLSGAEAVTALGLYEGETLYRELSTDTRVVEHLPIDKEVALVATYGVGENTYTTTYTLPVIKESEGLVIADGVIVGIGSCTDTTLYLNHPIGENAFMAGSMADPSYLIRTVYMGEGVTSIGKSAFAGCGNLKKAVMPVQLSETGRYIFNNCTNLVEVDLPDNLTAIAEGSFGYCSSLASIDLPLKVEKIENWAFIYSNLSSIAIPNSVISIGDGAFSQCSSLTDITIPDSVTSIGEGAFDDCSGLTSITIPNSVTSIGASAFRGCSSLTSITIPNSVTSIGYYAFFGCSSLTSITIPNSVTSIEEAAFAECSSLTDITIPDSVTSIGYHAFWKCTSLTDITIPDSVTSIGNGAFSQCSSLTDITIPDSVTSIGDRAFTECSNLQNIYFTGTKEQWKAIKGINSSFTISVNATIHYNYNPESES